MGKYQDYQYEKDEKNWFNKRSADAFIKLNREIDMDYRKLYDRMHMFELSHNRKTNLLKMLVCFDKKYHFFASPEAQESWFKLICRVERELNSPLKIQWRMKGGKNAS